MIAANAGFVTYRPHNNAGVVFVALKHALGAIKISLGPIGIVGKGVPVADPLHAVRFDICLVANVKTVFVAQFVKARIVGVVAGAYHVDVVGLHDEYIAHRAPKA